MNGLEWMEHMLQCRQTRSRIPLGLQATLPLFGRVKSHTAECWFYRLENDRNEVKIYSPEKYILWDAGTMNILKIQSMDTVFLGDGMDILTSEHRRKEDTYLQESLSDMNIDADRNIIEQWLAAAPVNMREWLADEIKRRDTVYEL